MTLKEKLPVATIADYIDVLRAIHQFHMAKFKKEHARPAEIADQLEKHSEEIGEFIKALKGKELKPNTPQREQVLDEYWDCVVSFMMNAFNPTLMLNNAEYPGITDAELVESFNKNLQKLIGRVE